MHPVCFMIGDRVIYWYGIMMALAFIGGILTWWIIGRKEGRDLPWASDMAFWIMLAGILGARAAYVLSDWSYFKTHWNQIWRIDQGGLIFYGGFIGAALMVLFLARHRHESILKLGDLLVLALPVGHLLGRIGCFLNGCCYGSEHVGALGVQYPIDSSVWWAHMKAGLIDRDSPWSRPVHPVQLYEAAANFLIFIALMRFYPRKSAPGQVMALYLMLYAPVRFVLEYFRGDDRLYWWHCSAAQGISLILFVAGAILWFAINRKRSGALQESDDFFPASNS